MRVTWIVVCAVTVVLVGCHRAEVEPPPRAETTAEKSQALEQNAAAGGDKATPSTAEAIKEPEAQAVDPAGNEPMDNAITCLARTIYWEARGEEEDSMEAIANVVMNRLGHDGYPNT